MSPLDITYRVGFVIGGLSLLVFLLGHTGLLSPVFIVLAVLVAVFFLWLLLRQGSISSGARFVSCPGPRPWLLHGTVLLFVLLVLPLALTPPSVRDELIHHLAVPAIYAREGRIIDLPTMPVSYFPMNIDLLYLIPLVLGNDIVPRLVHLAFGLLTAAVIYSYLSVRLDRRSAVLGVLLFLSTPVVMNLSRMAYVDLGATFFSTLALVGVLFWRDGDDRWLLYSALALGLALGSKYNMLISLMLLSLMVVHVSLRRRRGQAASLRTGALYFAVALVVFLPWLLRNYILAGSPLYPLIGAVSSSFAEGGGLHVGGSLSPVAKRYILYNESTLDILLVPLRIFWEGMDNSIERFDGVLNPFFLVFILFAFLRRGLKDLWYLVVFSVLFFYIAFFTSDLVIRYILPVLPPLVIISVWGLKNAFETRVLRYAATVFLFLFLAFNLHYLKGLYTSYRPISYLVGGETRREYLSRVLPDYRVVAYANENIPEDSKVYFLFTGDRVYYWERDVYYGDRTGGELVSLVKGARDAASLRDRFTSRGFTHLFVMDALLKRFALDNFGEDELAVLSGFFRDHIERLYGANGFSLYRII